MADDSRLAPSGGQVSWWSVAAAGRWRGGRRPIGSGRVHECVVVRAPGRQLGSAIRGSGRVHGRVVVSASGQAAGAARISKT